MVLTEKTNNQNIQKMLATYHTANASNASMNQKQRNISDMKHQNAFSVAHTSTTSSSSLMKHHATFTTSKKPLDFQNFAATPTSCQEEGITANNNVANDKSAQKYNLKSAATMSKTNNIHYKQNSGVGSSSSTTGTGNKNHLSPLSIRSTNVKQKFSRMQ